MRNERKEEIEYAEILIPDLKAPMRPRTQRVLRTLKVEDRARDDGLRNFPETGAAALTQVEEEILAEFKSGGADPLNQWVEKWLHRAAESVHEIELSAEEKEPTRVVDDAVAEVRHAIADGKEEVVKARTKERTEHRELRHFKAEHGLTRAARYPKSRIFGICLILTIAIVESLLNASFLGPANKLGLMGGFVVAAGIAFLNVGSAWLVGAFAIPNLRHKSEKRRFFAITGFCGLVMLAISLNLIVAHYRFAVEVEGTVTAVDSLRAGVFTFIADLESAMLFGMGVLSWIICTLKAAGLDDPYPGYGRADREYRQALKEYEEAKKSLRDRVGDIILRSGMRRIDGLAESAERKYRRYTAVVNRAMAVLRVGSDSIEALNEEQLICLKKYRESNVLIRTTAAPQYFENYPKNELRFSHASQAMVTRHSQFGDEVGVVRQRCSDARACLHEQSEAQLEATIVAIEQADQVVARRLMEDQDNFDQAAGSPMVFMRSKP